MNKAQLRSKYKQLRSTLSEESLEQLSIGIANQLLELPIWKHSYYHLFLPIAKQREVNTDYVLHILQGKDKHVVVSKSDFTSGNMRHFLLTDNTAIKPNSYGIPEPVDGIEIPVNKLEVVFVPLLAFDKTGQRVGYGKGFYDRFLEACNSNTIKVGLSFFEAEDLIEDVLDRDIALDYCVTPEQVYEFIKPDK